MEDCDGQQSAILCWHEPRTGSYLQEERLLKEICPDPEVDANSKQSITSHISPTAARPSAVSFLNSITNLSYSCADNLYSPDHRHEPSAVLVVDHIYDTNSVVFAGIFCDIAIKIISASDQ